MKQKTLLLLGILLLCAVCFGSGVLYGQFVLKNSGFVYTENASMASGMSADGKTDLNTADAETLCRISGIGTVTAEKIISSREKEGPFSDPHDLVDRGILGEQKYAEIAAELVVK